MLDFRGADAVSERAECAVRRRVAVAAHDRRARQGEALFGSDHVHDALPFVELIVILDAEVPGVLIERSDLRDAFGIGIGRVLAIVRRHIVIDHRERLLRCVHLAAGRAQALEGLRARHLVHQMAVDVEQAGAVVLLIHQMVFPDLVVQRARFHDSKCLGFQ